MNESVLRQIVRQEIRILSETKLVKTREGSRVNYGSDDHLNELERDLEELLLMRNSRKPRSRERFVLQQAVKHVRASLRRAQKLRDTMRKMKDAQKPLLTDGES